MYIREMFHKTMPMVLADCGPCGPSSREFQAMKKAKAKVKLNKDTAGDLRETKDWHPILMWKPWGIFVYLDWKHIVFVGNMFSSNIIFREVNCMNNFYLYLVSYIWLTRPLSSYHVVFSASTRVIIPCVSHGAVVAYWPPKKAVYFRESGQIVITRVHGLHRLFQRFP